MAQALALLLPACGDGDDGGQDAGSDRPCVEEPTTSVDLLVVVDASSSPDLRILAARRAEQVVAELEEDGWDVHVAALSTDLGLGPDVTGCVGQGDDGVFSVPEVGPGCSPAPEARRYWSGEPDGSIFAWLFCSLPGNGCGTEQPLEAVAKALSAESERLPDTRGSVHGDGLNLGFRRDGAVLAISIVTDDDDCSFSGERFSLAANIDPGVACLRSRDRLHPIERTVELLGELVGPERLVLELAVGIREEEQLEPLESLIGREHLTAVEVEGANSLVSSCRGDPDVINNAYPPERLLEAGRHMEGLGGTVALTSLCASAAAIEARNPLAEAIRAAGVSRCE